MIWLLLIPAALLAGLFIVDFQISAPSYKGPKSDHFNGRTFVNPDDKHRGRARGLFDMLKWALTGERGEWTRIKVQKDNYSAVSQQTAAPSDVVITFVNHTTFLIQINGMNLLTDPIWSNRASPYSWIGPKRMRPPGIRFDALPPIDAVLLSHNHYDHLDMPTVLRLQKQHDPFFITPLGVGEFLNRQGIPQTVDLDWWERHRMNPDITITGVPARHFSGRGVFDRDQTLWCGYVLQTPQQTLYFAGDTAYGGFFTDIGESFDIDLSIIPIGAYKPRWFTQLIHTDPYDAVQIHQEVQSTRSIASHFGTFPLADEGMKEPPQDLSRALKDAGLTADDFRTLKEGESFRCRGLKVSKE